MYMNNRGLLIAEQLFWLVHITYRFVEKLRHEHTY
jgi:hypothetical protein